MNALQEHRLRKGLTQPQVVAELKKVDPRADVALLSKYENGLCLPTLPQVLALEHILGTSREELFPGGEFDTMLPIEFDSDSEAALEVIKKVIAAIPEGRQNAISRAELAVRLNTSDRRARKLLELARCSGVIILNLQKNDGYFRIESGRSDYTAEEIEQLRQQEKQDTNRAMTILVRRKYIRQALKGAGVQI